MIYDASARKQYKAQARADIRAQFWPTMLTVVLEMVPIWLIAMISQVGANALEGNTENIGLYLNCMMLYLLATVFIAAPLQFGAKHYFVARARGQEASPMMVVSCFMSGKKYLTSIKLELGILLYSLGWAVLLSVAIVLVALLALAGFAMLVLGVIVAIIPLSLLVTVKVRRYDGAYICMIDTPDASVMQAIRSCAPIFKNHNWELLVFDLSFILWMLLGMITFGIGMIYVDAYTEIAFVHYFDALCGRKPQPDTPDISQLTE
ncbi:DUF975 family protein [Butyricicoccus sp.]|uniref:DUF975 family protein n=1 Tax=Butyricicoccus sp. TaxID=2049021 RepID=UPI003F14F426